MTENLPSYIGLVFIFTTALTVYLFYKAVKQPKNILAIVSAWLLIQALVSLSGFYAITNTLPPRFVLLVAPPLVLIALLFLTRKGREYMDDFNITRLTYLHTIRVPVELVLLGLYQQGKIPQLMTFEGRNFDVLAGLTAPLIAYYGFTKQKLSKTVMLVWNFIGLGLLLNIVINAVLSAPFVFQQFAFDQPDVAVLYFPFTWLPCCIVPIVLFSHLVGIRQLLRTGKAVDLQVVISINLLNKS